MVFGVVIIVVVFIVSIVVIIVVIAIIVVVVCCCFAYLFALFVSLFFCVHPRNKKHESITTPTLPIQALATLAVVVFLPGRQGLPQMPGAIP